MKLTIDKLVHGGMGMGTVEGKKIFVPYAAPGDVLDVEITTDHGDYAQARIVRILEPAASRVSPPCPVFGSCGGCQWQHIDYPTQLQWKRNIFIETLERLGRFERDVLETIVADTVSSPKQWNYRNRIQLQVDRQGRIGFHRWQSRDVVEFEKCLIADDRLNTVLAEKRELYRHATMRTVEFRLDDEVSSFSQVNTEQNETLRKIIIEWLQTVPHDRVLELHAGSGNFTFSIAALAREVVAIEVDGRAVRAAKERLANASVTNVQFLRSFAGTITSRVKGTFETIVLDPPRKGAEEALDVIVHYRPQTIIYVSCDPATLARDITRLGKEGWELKRSVPVDMFPQTFHIESVSFLKRIDL